jgi:hypothetical protein
MLVFLSAVASSLGNCLQERGGAEAKREGGGWEGGREGKERGAEKEKERVRAGQRERERVREGLGVT